MCFDWLKKKFRREKTREEKEKLQKEIEARILADYKRQAIRTRYGGPTMPKYQPCPKCHGDSKRDCKTEDGVLYKCVKHPLLGNT